MNVSRFFVPALLASAVTLVSLATGRASQAALLFDNGPFVTGIGNGAGGANTSVRGADSDNIGFGMDSANGTRVAEDFTIPTGQAWSVNTIDIFAYQTGSTTTSTFTSAFVTIYSDAPGGTVVGGDFTTNRLASAVWTGAYRVTPANVTGATRPIMQLTLDTSFLPSLGAGTYWIGTSATGSLTAPGGSNTFAVAVTPTPTGANAQQLNNSVWGPIDNNTGAAGTQPTALAFRVNGVVVPEASTGVLLLAAPAMLGAVALRRRFPRA